MDTRPKGKNQIALFRRVAQELVSKTIAHKNVAGVILLGGLIRNFVDRFSDLDIMVFLSRRDGRLAMQIRELAMEEKKSSTVDIDLEIHLLGDFKRRKWDETDRWDFSKCKIAFDPRGEIRKMLGAKLRVPRDFWTRRIAVCGEYVKWYGCPPKDTVGTIAEAWIERGDLLAAHYSLNYTVDLLLKEVFALNKEFLPPPKWRVFCSYDLKWLPKNHKELLREMMSVKGITARDFNRRLKAIRKLWEEILPKIEDETGLTSDQISRYYVEKILRQDFTSSSESMIGPH
jgi:predicted nucleotidyltransferase